MMVPFEDMKCGLVALVGVPNAGKSTLLNALVGEKVGIISSKPNTTRVTVRGVVTEGAEQMVFMDTPGMNRSSKAFDRRLVQQASGAANEADIVVILLDGSMKDAMTPRGDFDMKELAAQARSRKQKVVIVITKIDKFKDKAKLLPMLEALNGWDVDAVVPVTAVNGGGKGSGVERLKAELKKMLPEGPWLFPPEQVTDMPFPLRLAELTREQAMRQLHQEIPYTIGVVTLSHEEIEDGDDTVLLVQQQLLVAKEQHKPMVLGAKGSMLGTIGKFSRLEMEKIVGGRVRLELHVKVAENWLQREQWLREMGV